jgi:hypothetical protein
LEESLDGVIVDLQIENEWDFTHKFLVKRKVKTLARQNAQQQMVELVHLNTMVATYNHHFVVYNQGKKKVTQFIPSIVWKVVYNTFQKTYPN